MLNISAARGEYGGYGGYAYGGAVYADLGSTISQASNSRLVSVNIVNFLSNKVVGGSGGVGANGTMTGGSGGGGGAAFGPAGLFADTASVTLRGGMMTGNLAQGGAGAVGGSGSAYGGWGGGSGLAGAQPWTSRMEVR